MSLLQAQGCFFVHRKCSKTYLLEKTCVLKHTVLTPCRKREPGQVRTVNDRVEDFIHNTPWAQHALLFIVIAGTCAPSASCVLSARTPNFVGASPSFVLCCSLSCSPSLRSAQTAFTSVAAPGLLGPQLLSANHCSGRVTYLAMRQAL